MTASTLQQMASHPLDSDAHSRTQIGQRHQQRLKHDHQDQQQQQQQPDATKSQSSDRDARPPAKRARKAINCEPCRSSKLKCDRGRPCSSCVLRGTALMCYQGAADEGNDDHRGNRIDPHHEIARIRHSLATLEAYVIRGGAAAPPPTAPPPTASIRSESAPPAGPKTEYDSDIAPEKSAPGLLQQKGQGGLYAGPTSTATHLLSFKSAAEGREGEDISDRLAGEDAFRHTDGSNSAPDQLRAYDDDLLSLLPPLHIIDGLVDYYFEYCNWIYRHVHPASFLAAWGRYKAGQSADRLVLATLCVIMGLAIRYLPERHALLTSLSNTHEELGERYYDIARDALSRYRAEARTLSLELVELLLIRTHYLTLSKNDSEEIWAIRGELVSIGTAMGLHRDPDKWNMPREVAERRRWAWWHIILLERWQCFLFGRPLSIASHHFDTHLPSYVEPSDDPHARTYLPNIHLFKLAFILGDVVDDAVSIRPVPYERVQERDKQLAAWMEALPKELDLDEYRVARALASPIPATMRLGVQSIIIRTSYYHIRFTLHRPYAAGAHDRNSEQNGNASNPNSSSGKQGPGVSNGMDERMLQSLDTAVSAADKLIQLVGQARPDLLGNSSLAVPGHIHWAPFHCFSAAMFFSFQLIANPDQPGANLFRANVRRALDILNMSRGVAIADKASDILSALAPLYESTSGGETSSDREKKKRHVLSLVKGLAFPYHDSPPYPRSHIDSPGGALRRSIESPLQGSPPSLIQGMPPAISPVQANALSHSTGELSSPIAHRSSPSHVQVVPAYIHGGPTVQQSSHHALSTLQPQQPSPVVVGHHTSTHFAVQQNASVQSLPNYAPHMQRTMYQTHPSNHTPEYPDPNIAFGYPVTQQAQDGSMWGASVGFGQGEWTRFLDVMQRGDSAQI